MSEFVVERQATVDAPATAVFPLLVDFRRWQSWSPWEGLDPDLQRTYSEPSSGVGATYHWQGNRKAGEGTMAITGATEPTALTVRLEFLKPWKGVNTVRFVLAQAGEATQVTWTMQGRKSTLMRIFGVVISMDKLVGGDFEKGLAALKRESEAAAA